jgi:D-beta-D-heptose 7-phosphate kinase/D-beta-D-heptose 1-phosphate adenosyltransferase
MKKSDPIPERILKPEELKQEIIRLRIKSKTIAFINGVFDVLNASHLALLSKAASFSDVLIVGVNSDASAKRINGSLTNNENSRALVLASLLMVDDVIIFDEDTPIELIKIIQPDVLVHGGNDAIDTIAGTKEVLAAGGRVEAIPVE